MIEFYPVGDLRALGKHRELKIFTNATENLNTVERFAASLFFRFALDINCPALLVKVPKKGDEPLPDMCYVKDFDEDYFLAIAAEMFDLAAENFGTNEISVYRLGIMILLMKNDFMKGDWSAYGNFVEGVDGISIPTKPNRGTR